MKPKKTTRHVFRPSIEETRDGYDVIYQPADVRSPVASLKIEFSEDEVEERAVTKTMEKELESWLKRFAVPLKVAAFGPEDEPICISKTSSSQTLMGYVRLVDDAIVRRWGWFEDTELPKDQADPAYLEREYKGVPFRLREEDRERLGRERRDRWMTMARIAGCVIFVPVMVYLIASGARWPAILLVIGSIAAGVYQLTGVMGWRGLTRREERRAEKNRLMDHYFFHCERNPKAFTRLKNENFEREVLEEERRARTEAVVSGSFPERKERTALRWLGAAVPFRAKKA